MSKDKIIRLVRNGPLLGESPPEVVAQLKQLLDAAKRGEIKGLGFFFVDGADTTVTHWVQGCAARNDMIAASARLHWRVQQAADEGAGE